MRDATKVYPTIAYEKITVSSTPIGFTRSLMTKNCHKVICIVEGDTDKGLRFRTDGTNPTSNDGVPIYPGVPTYGTGPVQFEIDGYRDISRFRAIRYGDTDCTLHVRYMGSK